MRKLVSGFLDLLYPPRCHICGEHVQPTVESALCPICLEQVTFLQNPVCTYCGKEMGRAGGDADRFCGECLKNPPPYDCARSIFHYRPPVSTLLQRLKFSGDSGAAESLVTIMSRAGVAVAGKKFGLIVPVPLHVSRLRERGLNQSLTLARQLFPDHLEKINPLLLVRTRNTPAQTGLDGKKRRANLRGAFTVISAEAVQNRNICLLDDVYTTGTTVSECAQTLKQAGAATVRVLTLARV